MKPTRLIGWILAWFNLVFWGIPIVSSILQSVSNPLILLMLVFLATIPLNSFAALRLHRSIRNPQIPLNHQTPVGIRFVGTFALIVGGIIGCCGIVIAQNAQQFLPSFKEQMTQYGQTGPITAASLQEAGIFMLVLGVAAVVNVILHFRLLRWYLLVRKNDAGE